MNSTSPMLTDDPAAHGLLRVEVPHWAAQIRVFDSRGRLARQPDDMLLAKTTTDGLRTVWQATTRLAPGVYEVELALEGQTARQLAIVREGLPCQLAQTSWPSLSQLSVAAPLLNTATDRDTHRVAAERWSRELTWKKSSGTSRLFLFIRTLTPGNRNRFWDNLSLLDHNETLITDFSASAKTNEREGWLAFSADLPAGGYLLRRQRYDQYRTKYQPLYLCEGWETHIFLTADRRPSLQTMLLNMVPPGTGFRADDEAVMAVSVLLNSLRRSTGPDRLVTVDTVSTLMGDRADNPWLSILIGYVIRLQQDQLNPGDDLPERWPAVLALWPTLMDRLATLDQHPDVQALRLEMGKPAETPILFPPLLFPGLRRVQQHALQFSQTITPGSLLKRVLPRVSTTSAWTAWRHVRKPASRPQTPDSLVAGEGDVLESPAAQPAPQPIRMTSPNYLRLITPKLPVYQVRAPGSSVAQRNVQPVSEAFLNVMALQAAQNLSSTDLNDIPLTTRISSEQNVGSLLRNANADEISQASGVPLAQVQSSLNRLQIDARQPLKATKNLTLYDQTVFGHAVQRAIDTVDDPLLTTIEECVSTLLTEAGRLVPRPGGKAFPGEIDGLIGRIVGLTDQLLLSARFVAVTDTDGKILLNNGVFVTLLNQPFRSAATDLTQWESFFKTAPFGRSKLPYEYVKKGSDAWTLQRTVLHDDDRNEVVYLNLFQNADGLVLTPEWLKRFQKQLPKLILSTSSIAYDQRASGELPEDQHRHIEKLSDTLTQMERVLTVVE